VELALTVVDDVAFAVPLPDCVGVPVAVPEGVMDAVLLPE